MKKKEREALKDEKELEASKKSPSRSLSPNLEKLAKPKVYPYEKIETRTPKVIENKNKNL